LQQHRQPGVCADRQVILFIQKVTRRGGGSTPPLCIHNAPKISAELLPLLVCSLLHLSDTLAPGLTGPMMAVTAETSSPAATEGSRIHRISPYLLWRAPSVPAGGFAGVPDEPTLSAHHCSGSCTRL
jgi:hypothetical protein